MNIDIKDTVTLDDNNDYIVVCKALFEDKNYLYLIDIKNVENIKFCYENIENNSLIEVDDQELIRKLLPLFLDVHASID